MSDRPEETTPTPAPRWRRPPVLVLLGALVLILAIVLALSGSDRTAKPMPPNGDVLGPAQGESAEAYGQRAGESLEEALAGWPEEESWALVTFHRPVSGVTAGDVSAPIQRVSAVLSGGGAPVVVPEPVAGTSRAETFARVGMGGEDAPISGLVVWDRPSVLRAVAEEPTVLSVEVLPSDAQWGRFGVRPPSWGDAAPHP